MAVVHAVKPAEFRILGPISVLIDGEPVALGGPKQRALLAALLLRAGTPVGVDDLIDAVWGDAPPATAAKAVQVAITNLRRLLGHERIRTHGPAYAVEIVHAQLDAERFEQLAEEGAGALKAGAYTQASEILRSALALWRGRVCEDISFESHVNAEAERLEELRRVALHDRVEADLALGHHAQFVPELERLVALYPLDEELRAQHMLALYRSGRQGDALQAYQDARRRLVEALGVEPGDRLRGLHRSILEQDPRLAVPEQPPSHTPAAAVRDGRSRRRHLVAAGVVVALVAAAVVGIFESVGSGGRERTLAADSVGVIDAGSGSIEATAAGGPEPTAIAYGHGAAWVADSGGNTVERIAPDGRPVDTIDMGGNVTAIASSPHAVWAVSGEARSLDEIDPGTDTVVRPIAVGNGARAVAVGGGSAWVANGIDGSISRVNLRSGHETTIPVGGTPVAVAFGDHALWVADAATNTVLRLDPQSNTVSAPIGVGRGPDAIAAGGGSVWVANGLDGTASRIASASDSVTTTVPVGSDPTSVALAGDSVWIGSGGAGAVRRMNSHTGEFEGQTVVGTIPAALAAAGSRLWVTSIASAASRRGGTLRLLGNTGGSVPAVDPALDWSAEGWQVLAITNDGLLTYRRVGGVDGNDLEPDLAQSIPPPSDNGRSYTFTLRSGIRYSDGQLVRASDVRASLERVFRLHSPTLGSFELGLVGEAACLARPGRCDLSRGIETDNRTRTVTFRLVRPNPAFLQILALPVYDILPAGTRAGAHIATGPYRVASLKHSTLLLVRNERFHEWSAAAQPYGFPNRISWSFHNPPQRSAARDVLSGRFDVLAPSPPALSSLAVRVPALLHSDRTGFVHYLFLNTKRAPFDSLDARRALNLAIDRTEIVTASGGRFMAEPTCEVLPPNMAGYQPYCPYTAHPGPGGTWSAPDLLRAQRLVARSGTRGQRVAVWTQSDRRSAMVIGREVTSLLRSLGYRASLVARPAHAADSAASYDGLLTNGRTRAQIGLQDWAAAYPSPANFFEPLLTCEAARTGDGFNLSRFCNPRIDRMIADGRWAEADRAVVDQAPLVPLVADRQVTLVSRRVGDYQYNPVLGGPLIDQLWISRRGSLSVR